MLSEITFERKTFRIRAVQVTKENMSEVANWCGGPIRVETGNLGLGDAYIEVPIGRGAGRAYVGDWVTRLVASEDYRVYKNKSFREAFRSTTEDLQYSEIHRIISEVMRLQDMADLGESTEGADKIAHEATNKILRLLY